MGGGCISRGEENVTVMFGRICFPFPTFPVLASISEERLPTSCVSDGRSCRRLCAVISEHMASLIRCTVLDCSPDPSSIETVVVSAPPSGRRVLRHYTASVMAETYFFNKCISQYILFFGLNLHPEACWETVSQKPNPRSVRSFLTVSLPRFSLPLSLSLWANT